MYISKMFFCMSTALVALATVGSVSASEADTSAKPAILFKIHDIVPVKNDEGEVISCDYTATFYNRSSVNVSGAVVDFVWHDQAIADVVEQEKQEDAKENNRNVNRARSVTERTTEKDVSTTIEVPAISPSGQVSVPAKVNTDRCFLLIEDVDFNVKSCNATSFDSAQGTRNGGSSCSGLFMYVSPKDAQYYMEFKAVSVAAQKSEKESELDKQKKQVEGTFHKTVNTLETAGTILSNIK